MNENELKKYRINPTAFVKEEQQSQPKAEAKENQKQSETPLKTEDMEQKAKDQKTEFTQFDINKIPESEYAKLGIKPEDLKGEIKAMSYGFKSPHLVDIKPVVDGEEFAVKARISIAVDESGKLSLEPHPRQQEVDLEKPFHGVMLSDEQKQNLMATGNAGQVIELDPKGTGEKIPSLVSVDIITNRLEAIAVDKISISQNIKGTTLSRLPTSKRAKRCWWSR